MTLLNDLWKEAEVGNLDKIAFAALWELKEFDIYTLNSYANNNKEALSTLYKTRNITDESIDKALRESVIKRGKIDCDILLLPRGCIGILGMRAERLGMPECLAYCITEKIFPDEILKRIPLKRGETIDSFVDKYGKKDILAGLRANLLNPRPETLIPDMSYLTPPVIG